MAVQVYKNVGFNLDTVKHVSCSILLLQGITNILSTRKGERKLVLLRMVLHRSLYLVVLQLGLCVHCYILLPNYSYDQTSTSGRNINLPAVVRDPMQRQGWSIDEERGLVQGLSEKRMERHVDAIFTNTYRKFLGQISARRYLQNMMGKRLGQNEMGEQYPSDNERSDRSLQDKLKLVLIKVKNPVWKAAQPQQL